MINKGASHTILENKKLSNSSRKSYRVTNQCKITLPFDQIHVQTYIGHVTKMIKLKARNSAPEILK